MKSIINLLFILLVFFVFAATKENVNDKDDQYVVLISIDGFSTEYVNK